MQRVTSVVLLVWSLLYALPHLYWGLGGTFGMSVYKPSAREMEQWEAAHLFAFVFITATGLLGFALERTRARRAAHLLVLAVVAAGAAIAASHGAYGILFRALSVAGATEVDGGPFHFEQHGWVLWDMLAIEPWFLIEGVLLGLAGYFALATRDGQRLWLWAVGALFSIGFATAALQLQVG
jgi:hypothetical protein